MCEKLIFKQNDEEYMKLCLDITLYWTGSVFDHTAGVLEFYNKALDLIRDRLKYYVTHDMGPPEQITNHTLHILPDWLSQANKKADMLSLSLETSPDAELPSDTAFEFWAVEYPEEPAGMVRLMLPTNFIKESPESLIELAKVLAKDLEFHSGHGGFAINWDFKDKHSVAANKEMAVLSRRYPGIDLPEVASTLIAIPQGIKRVNWLTFIGRNLLDASGVGDSTIKLLDSEGIRVDELPGGILAVAGCEPKLGDVNRQEDLGAYHRVGKALALMRNRDHPPFLENGRGMADEEITNEWLAYFDS